jgi:hypothetical protein
MQNRLEDARKHYAKVEGALAAIAEERIKALDSKDAQEAVKWLATAELPRPAAPTGPGVPGLRPPLNPTAPPTDAPEEPLDASSELHKIIGGLNTDTEPDRYGEPESPAVEATGDPAAEPPPAESPPPEAADPAPAEPAAGETASEESSEPPASDEPAAEEPPAPQP